MLDLAGVRVLARAGLLAPVRDQLVQPVRLLAGDRVAALAYAVSSVLVGWALCERLWRRGTFLKV